MVSGAGCLALGAGAQAPGQAEPPRLTTLALDAPLPSAGRLGGVSVDRNGNIYVSDFGASVWRVDPQGRVRAMRSDLRGSSGNTVTRDGRILQASFVDNAVVEIGPDGSSRTVIQRGLDGPIGLTSDSAGRVYVCNCRSNSISVTEPDGETRTLAQGGRLDCPNGITIGPDGWLHVVSFNNTDVVSVSPEAGDMRTLATLPGSRNAHIAAAAGSLYVTQIETGELYRVEGDGRFTRVLGGNGQGLRDGDAAVAQLAHPNGIAASADGRFLVLNDLEGAWRGTEETRILLRRLGPLGPVGGREPERITIRVGDLVFDARSSGPSDGPLVLLLHGFPETSYAFRYQLGVLGSLGFHAVAPDQRGYSAGARPDAVADYAIGKLAEDIVGIADALGAERFDLVGHDWGGAVAWVVATRYAKRVRTLTVLSTPHYAALSAARAGESSDQARRSSYFSDFAADGAEKRFLADGAAYLRRLYDDLPADAVEEYVRVLADPEAMRAALAWYAAAFRPPAQKAETAPPPQPTRIRPVPVPTLYVWSTGDPAFGRAAAEATASYVSGPYRFVVLEGVDHWIAERVPERVTRLIVEQIQR